MRDGADTTDVCEFARSVLSEMFGLAPEVINSDTLLREQLDLDSIDLVDFLAQVNDRYELSLTIYDFEKVTTFGQCCELLREAARK